MRERIDERARRIASNEALYREVNERMGALQRAFELPGDTLKIVCECGNRECVERIDISTDDYEEVRCNSIDFIVVPDHDERDVEEVVRNEAGYQVVRKTAPKGRAVARENDPRN